MLHKKFNHKDKAIAVLTRHIDAVSAAKGPTHASLAALLKEAAELLEQAARPAEAAAARARLATLPVVDGGGDGGAVPGEALHTS